MAATITVDVGTTPAQAFPSEVIDVEVLVFTAIQEACAIPTGGAAALPYFADGRPGSPEIPVVRGWPAYPGKVPVIGVAAGTESEDKSAQLTSGGFAADVVAYDTNGTLIGSAAYYSEPLYAPIIVQLIHENRDERDRLHNALRLVLFPLRRRLPAQESHVKTVEVDAEKNEVSGGVDVTNEPFHLYVSVFTVHVFHELLEATEITGPDGVVTVIDGP